MKKMMMDNFFEVDVQHPEKLHDLHNDLPCLPERMKNEKDKFFFTNLHDKTEYVLMLRKLHTVIKFNQKVQLKPHISVNTNQRKVAKIDFEIDFLKLMNNAVFGKTMGNVRKHRDIRLVTTEIKRNYLVLEPNYHTAKVFYKKFVGYRNEKTQILMNKPVYLEMSIL